MKIRHISYIFSLSARCLHHDFTLLSSIWKLCRMTFLSRTQSDWRSCLVKHIRKRHSKKKNVPSTSTSTRSDTHGHKHKHGQVQMPAMIGGGISRNIKPNAMYSMYHLSIFNHSIVAKPTINHFPLAIFK